MGVLVTCKIEDDPFKNDGAIVVTKDLNKMVKVCFQMLKGS